LEKYSISPGKIKLGDIGCPFLKKSCCTEISVNYIIRGGENIAPNEVINAIATNPAVADVKVVGVPSEFWGEEVAAGIILKPGASITDEELKTYLAPRLSKCKIPEYFVRYMSFPMLSNGKVDMTSLKQNIIRKVSAGK